MGLGFGTPPDRAIRQSASIGLLCWTDNLERCQEPSTAFRSFLLLLLVGLRVLDLVHTNEVLFFTRRPISKEKQMADLAALKAAVDAAEAAKEALLVERRANKVEMNKRDFASYNAATYQDQIDIEKALIAATKDFQAELKVIRADAVDNAINVAVGTISEEDGAGGAS
jgi:hypothetical protein